MEKIRIIFAIKLEKRITNVSILNIIINKLNY